MAAEDSADVETGAEAFVTLGLYKHLIRSHVEYN